MSKYELAIACVDESEIHRKKEGDIIAVRPYPFNWGLMDIKWHLIVIIDSPEDIQIMRATYEIPLYVGGLDRHPADDIEWEDRPEKLKKNRFQIPLNIIKDGWITDLDINKVQDKSYIYQPFKRASQLTSKFTGRNKNHFLESKDVDCISSVAMANAEFVINTSEQVSLIYDKYKESFKYPTLKVASSG